MEDRYIIHWVGWDNSFTKGTQHDKVWGWLEMRDGRIYNFWGARGKTLRFKSHHSKSSVISVQRVKERGEYKYVEPTDYDRLVKDFIDDVELYCMTAILSDTVM